MTRVLAFLDDSAAAQPVLQAAAAVAPVFGASVEAVHVDEEAETTPEEVAGSAGVPYQRRHGDVIDELLSATHETDVSLVVIGARRHPGGHRSSGHVVRELADRSDTPMLVVPPDTAIQRPVRRVLIAMKGTPTNAKHLKRTIDLASDADLEIVVLHVDDETTIPSFSDQWHYDVDVYAREFLERYVPAVKAARLELRIGDPTHHILEVADAVRADVIAVGHRAHRFHQTDRTIVAELLERSHRPVLLTPVR